MNRDGLRLLACLAAVAGVAGLTAHLACETGRRESFPSDHWPRLAAAKAPAPWPALSPPVRRAARVPIVVRNPVFAPDDRHPRRDWVIEVDVACDDGGYRTVFDGRTATEDVARQAQARISLLLADWNAALIAELAALGQGGS